MMMTIVFNEQQHISMVSRQTIAAVRVQVSHKRNQTIVHWHMNSADCCLIGIVLGVTTTKITSNNNTIQYLQISPSTE